jgi:hypothetical protein
LVLLCERVCDSGKVFAVEGSQDVVLCSSCERPGGLREFAKIQDCGNGGLLCCQFQFVLHFHFSVQYAVFRVGIALSIATFRRSKSAFRLAKDSRA